MKKKIAIVLFNLGGPDSFVSVRPFLFNLFNDPAIINQPAIVRKVLAWILSTKREKTAKDIYNKMGGKSPILDETNNQAKGLERALNKEKELYKVFVCMRYWHPMVKEVVPKVLCFKPDEIFLIPLYPQFSTTTTGSFFSSWENEIKKYRDKTITKRICCYPGHNHFIQSHVYEIKKVLKKIINKEKNLHNIRMLFSAHGLPEKIIKNGDPYQYQIDISVKKILEQLKTFNLDVKICFQSKVGPLKWLTPSTDQEIIKASRENKTIVIVPIAFVSEHSETLVELDIDYKQLAAENGCDSYHRVPALKTNTHYISCLSSLVKSLYNNKSERNERICPEFCKKCFHEGLN